MAMKKYAISFAIVYFWMAGACLLARHLVQNRLLAVLLNIAFVLLPDQWVIAIVRILRVLMMTSPLMPDKWMIVMMQAGSLLDAF